MGERAQDVALSGAPPLRPGRSGRWALGYRFSVDRGVEECVRLLRLASGMGIVTCVVATPVQVGDGSQRQMVA
jgi:hypothetical protein